MEQNFKLNEIIKLDEESLTDIEQVVLEKNLARTKGFLLGATIVGGSWLGSYLYKKFKQRKVEVVEEADLQEDNENTVD